MYEVEKNGVRQVVTSQAQLDAFLTSGWCVVSKDNNAEDAEKTVKRGRTQRK